MKSKLFSLLPVGALVVVAGCMAAPEVTTPPVEMTFTQSKLPVQKFEIAPFRTMIQAREGVKQAYVSNVPCRLKGSGFKAQFSSPANLRLPVSGINTGDLAVTCTYEGKSITRSFKARNFTSERIANSGAGAGFVGAIIAMGVADARGNQPTDQYGYGPLTFVLNPANGSK